MGFKSGLADCLCRARQLRVVPSRFILVVSIRKQAVGLYVRQTILSAISNDVHGARGSWNRQTGGLPHRVTFLSAISKDIHGARGSWNRQARGLPYEGAPLFTSAAFRFLRAMRCSTSKFGIGEKADSNMTPRGLHRIANKIGGGWPIGTVFKSRQMVGYTWNGLPKAAITTRILWLEGLEPGFNRGGDVDSHSRYIYIHGTGDEPGIGRPASHGCVQLSGDDLIPLYRLLPVGTLVWISAA